MHLASGNKYQLEIDLPPNPGAPGLELIRHYNGLSRLSGALGSNWSFSYDVQLQWRGQSPYVRQGDGSVRPARDVSRVNDGFLWRWPNGRRLRFDLQGRLTGISHNGRQLLSIRRHEAPPHLAGKIDRVQTADGQALVFEYAKMHGQAILAAVRSPLGRFEYEYELPPSDSAHRTLRLVAVLRPDGMRRLYHHEPEAQGGNPYALTGVSVQPPHGRPQRLTSWEYDRYSRVIRVHHHGRELPSVEITYLRAATTTRTGHTRVANSRGRKAEFHFARNADGSYRLLGPDLEYSGEGWLARVDGTRLVRSPGGTLEGLLVPHTGWPGLRLHYQRPIRQLAWHSDATGTTEQQADPLGRPASLRYANGDTLELSFDAQNRPIRMQAYGAQSQATHATSLRWRGSKLVGVEHPHEREVRRLGKDGKVRERRIERPALLGAPPFRYREAFYYDRHGRLVRHDLPEGGALIHAWETGPGSRPKLTQLILEDAEGTRHTIVESDEGSSGYRYGNGLEMLTVARGGPHADTLQLTRAGALLWQQTRRYDNAGRVTLDRHDYPAAVAARAGEELSFAYDNRSRVSGARHQHAEGTETWWFAWHDDGRLASYRREDPTYTERDDSTYTAHVVHDRAGLPIRSGEHMLHYGPGRRLEKVTGSAGSASAEAAQYRHNAFGHRIAKKVGEEVVHFLYWHDRLVAEARSPGTDAPPVVTRRYLHAGPTPVGMIEYQQSGAPRLYAVHADLSGAPRLLTDEHGEIRWMASYSPLGQAQQRAGDLHFPLRLPGQYEDSETGWHDNLLRTYVPAAGHYLEPDPLGPLPGNDTYGYAVQQPWRYADPSGLLLFAFDGTRYSADTRGNVWKLAQAYGSTAHYHSGPGNSSFLDWDAVVAWRAGRILENQWQSLLTSLEFQPKGVVMPIDIVGFSRGAALARDFANRIAAHTHNGLFTVQDSIRGQVSACVDLRFMGLFDTVAQFGVGGSHNYLYDFGIDAMWSWVSHAVALHEHRWTFPLTSATQGAEGNVVEAPFVGAHADIGGGLALYDMESSSATDAGAPAMEPDPAATEATNNELAKIALQWMRWQALAATVDFNELDATDTTIATAQLRDMRSPLWRTIQHGDRSVTSPDGAAWLSYQNEHPRLGAAQRERVEAFIKRLPDWRSGSGDIVGTVDMDGYAEWLHETLGWAPH